jgi:glycosyltransferase involved in cell wall biosynthesis
MSLKISLAIAAHNEEKYLPYLLNSLIDAPIYELVICLDNCTDNSKDIVEKFKRRTSFKVKIVELKNKTWHNPTAEPFAVAAKNCIGDVVYVAGADFYIDQGIFRSNWSNSDVQSFGLTNYSLNSENGFIIYFRHLFRTNYERLRWRMKGLGYCSCPYAYKKGVYKSVQHEDVDSEDWRFLTLTQQKGFRYKFHGSSCLHLRPDGPRNLRFKAEEAASYVPVWKAIGLSLIQLNLGYFKWYWKRKRVRNR